MPAWITVYCAQGIDGSAAEALRKEFARCDFRTLAEDYEVDDELVDPALEHLRIEPAPDGFALLYGGPQDRPVAIRLWSDPARVAEEVAEVREALAGNDGPAAKHIRRHLERVQAVVGIELGFGQLEDMGIVFAFEVARWFGEHRDGLIKDDRENWTRIEQGGFSPL